VASGETLPPWPALRAWVVCHRGQTLLTCASALLAVLVGLDVGGVRSQVFGGPGGAQAIRMAVLPFANLSGDPQQEYLSDGLTQEMIAQLGRLHPDTLSVIARTSVMRYKKTETPIDKIGRELGVQYVLEGSAQREGGRVRVSAELIQVKDQAQLWADTYERELAGALVLESDVARQVADALALKLLPGEQTRLASAHSVNPEAYDAYLKGSQYWIKLTKEGLDTAQGYFDIALQKDPGFAKAWVGRYWVWACRNQMGYVPRDEAAPKMREAALRAIALDDGLAESHYALAAFRTWGELDLRAAGPEWKRAVGLDPNYPDGIAMYSHYLAIMGHVDEAMTQIDRAVSLDPFNVNSHRFRSLVLVFARRYDDAIAEAHKALTLGPGNLPALGALIPALWKLGRNEEALASIKEYFGVFYAIPDLDSALDRGFAEAGLPGAMQRGAEVLAPRAAAGEVSPTDVAWMYSYAGDKAHALDWLERAYEVRDPGLPYLGSPDYDPLRAEPRFQALLRKMGLPEA
jgi:TolB-like protein